MFLYCCGWSGRTLCARSYLEESGRPWACLNGSRSFGLRHVLAGHPCRRWVSEARGGSRIDVEVVREQLGGQGILCIEVCCDMGQVVPPNHPLVGGTSCFSMGRVRSGWLSKFQCNPELFRVIPEWSGQLVLFWEVSEWSGHHWKPLTGHQTAGQLSW